MSDDIDHLLVVIHGTPAAYDQTTYEVTRDGRRIQRSIGMGGAFRPKPATEDAWRAELEEEFREQSTDRGLPIEFEFHFGERRPLPREPRWVRVGAWVWPVVGNALFPSMLRARRDPARLQLRRAFKAWVIASVIREFGRWARSSPERPRGDGG